MALIVRYLGWAANIMLAALLVDGYIQYASLSAHMRWGLGLCLLLPLIYLLPYFSMIGVTARLKAAVEKGEEEREKLLLALKLKNKLFLPVLAAVLLCITGPVLGFLERGGRIPANIHGIYMLVFMVVHVVTWVRCLFVLGLARELSEID